MLTRHEYGLFRAYKILRDQTMRIAFIQNMIDSISGKSEARKNKRNSERDFSQALEDARNRELARIDEEFALTKSILSQKIKVNIQDLETRKTNVHKLAAAIVASFSNNIKPL